MAKCEKREIKPVPPPVEYVLTLSAKEAERLRGVLGEETDSITGAIFKALGDAGLRK